MESDSVLMKMPHYPFLNGIYFKPAHLFMSNIQKQHSWSFWFKQINILQQFEFLF